jgi:hypothetical protein
VDFLDEDPALATATSDAPDRRRRRKPPRPPRQQILLRRGIAVGVGLLILILLVLGVRGCLNARKKRGLEDYARDVAALVQESNQTSRDLFGLLEDPGSLSSLDFQSEIQSDRQAADSQSSRVDSLDVPGDMDSAQRALDLSFELRSDALGVISERMSTALGNQGREQAIDAIAHQMQVLLASDIVYSDKAKPEIERVLAEEDIQERIPDSGFLPDLSWLDSSNVDAALGLVSGAEAAAPGIHGMGLISTSIDGVALTEGVPVTIDADGAPEAEVTVQNQGESEESGVEVSVEVDGGDQLTQTIDTIAPQETQSVTIPLTSAPSGEVELTVAVATVPGEEVETNNEQTYAVVFQ